MNLYQALKEGNLPEIDQFIASRDQPWLVAVDYREEPPTVLPFIHDFYRLMNSLKWTADEWTSAPCKSEVYGYDIFTLALRLNENSFRHLLQKYPKEIISKSSVISALSLDGTAFVRGLGLYRRDFLAKSVDLLCEYYATCGFDAGFYIDRGIFTTKFLFRILAETPLPLSEQSIVKLLAHALMYHLLNPAKSGAAYVKLMSEVSNEDRNSNIKILDLLFKRVFFESLELLKDKKLSKSNLIAIDQSVAMLVNTVGHSSTYTYKLSADDTKKIQSEWEDFKKTYKPKKRERQSKKHNDASIQSLLLAFFVSCGVTPIAETRERYIEMLLDSLPDEKAKYIDLCIVKKTLSRKDFFQDFIKNLDNCDKISVDKKVVINKLFSEEENLLEKLLDVISKTDEDYIETLENIVLNRETSKLLRAIANHPDAPSEVKEAILDLFNDTSGLMMVNIRQNARVEQALRRSREMAQEAVAATSDDASEKSEKKRANIGMWR